MNFRHHKLSKYISIRIKSQKVFPYGKKLEELIRLLRGVLIVTPGVTSIIILVRLLGWLQPIELATLDLSFRLRPPEPPDDRIVIVGVEESDIQRLQQWPLSDTVLAQLLKQIKKQKPSAIGLDIYRNLPVEPGHKEIVKVFKTTTNLFGIKKAIGDRFSSEVNASPILEKSGRATANDIVVDTDGVLRRGMLFPIPRQALPSLGLMVAATYLEKKGIKPSRANNGFMQLGTTVFTPFNSNDGGYIHADDGGYQILLNYRGSAHHFRTVSAMDVLENRIPKDFMRDHIVLVGNTAVSLNDSFYTPYSNGSTGTPVRTAGVEIQANLASQILSSVLDGRPLIQVWPKPLENFWIVIWVLCVTSFAWSWRNLRIYIFLLRLTALLFFGVTSVCLIGYTSFLIGWWIPVAPTVLAILSASIAISGYVYFDRLKELNSQLGLTVYNLEQALDNLEKSSQIQLIQSEKMSTLGQLVSGVAHEINNPVGFISVNLNYLSGYITDLTNHLLLYQKTFPQPPDELVENAETIDLEYILEDLPKILASMEIGAKRINDISTSLRTFSRSDTTNKVSYNIHEGIDSTLLILKHRLKATSERSEIHIIKEYGQLPLVTCYPGQLNQVIMNLVANAIDVFDEFKQNQDSLETQAINHEIKISTEVLPDTHYVVIRVKDNGPGMTDEIKQKIFEKLFTTKAVGKGTGLGLSISREIIVEAHGGKLTCNSTPNAGAEFIIEIPIA